MRFTPVIKNKNLVIVATKGINHKFAAMKLDKRFLN